jgi:hypothetical protein
VNPVSSAHRVLRAVGLHGLWSADCSRRRYVLVEIALHRVDDGAIVVDEYEGLLLSFDRSVLAKYRASPDLYILEETDNGGRLENKQAESDPAAWYRVRFAFRRLASGSVCVAAFGPDIGKLPEQEGLVWRGYLIGNPTFAQKDPAFERWVSQHLKASWVEEGARYKLERQIRLIRALTSQVLGKPLLRFDAHQLLNYPAAENTEAYAKAHLELYRLVVDGLASDAISALADHLGIHVSDSSLTLNSLKQVLPSHLIPDIHEPLRKCKQMRNKLHGVSSQPTTSFPAFDAFQVDLGSVAEALAKLCKWLESELKADAEKCLERERTMSTLFPQFVGPPRPAFKLSEIKRAEGKTIETVGFGEEPIRPGKHQSEGIVIHFTDGSSMAIVVGSNAMNLSVQFEGLKPEDVSTDLVVFWAPSIEK